jgi:hypothetical protein
MRHRIMLVVTCAVVSTLVFAPATAGASVSAKTSNPCKLLKRPEITEVMGAAAAKGARETLVDQCEWVVEASAEFPVGSVYASIQAVGGRIAYETLSELPTNEKVPELGKAYYEPQTGAIGLLKGEKLLIVQSVFISTEGGIGAVDRKAETIELTKIARKRV